MAAPIRSEPRSHTKADEIFTSVKRETENQAQKIATEILATLKDTILSQRNESSHEGLIKVTRKGGEYSCNKPLLEAVSKILKGKGFEAEVCGLSGGPYAIYINDKTE